MSAANEELEKILRNIQNYYDSTAILEPNQATAKLSNSRHLTPQSARSSKFFENVFLSSLKSDLILPIYRYKLL